jgi:hypothetical protein
MKQESKALAPARREVPLVPSLSRVRNVTDRTQIRASGVILVTFRPPPHKYELRLPTRQDAARKAVLDILNFLNLSGWTRRWLSR